ncbi:MAG: lytic murein transglycosylase [Caldimicrobium sp.]
MRPVKSLKFIYLFLIILFLGVVQCRGQEPLSGKDRDECLKNFSEEIKPYVKNFLERVKEDLKGRIPENYICNIFSRSEITFKPEVMIRSLTWREAKLPYHQFLEENRIIRAKRFMEENRDLLLQLEEKFGVNKEVLVAIFLVETDLGRKTGEHTVFNTFFSLALTGEEPLFKGYVENNKEIDFNNETVRNRWKRRSDWAYRELLYLIEISYKNNWDPFAIKGSIFGAFGYPQFVPKSYIIYGYDWDGDGKVDLFSIPDALASIANYLKGEGYKMEASREFKKRVIMKYNISEPYAETILKVAELLQEIKSSQDNAKRRN